MRVDGLMVVPVTIAGITKTLKFRVTPQLTTDCNLGMDSIIAFGFCIDGSTHI